MKKQRQNLSQAEKIVQRELLHQNTHARGTRKEGIEGVEAEIPSD